MTGNLADYYYFDLNLVQTHLGETRFESISEGKETLLYEVFSPDGIHIWYYRSSLPLDKTIVIENNAPFFHLHFEFNSASTYQNEQSPVVFTAHPGGRFNLFYFPVGKFSISIPATEKLEIFNCNISPAFFLQYIPTDHPLHNRLYLLLNSKEAAALMPEFPSNSQLVRQIILDILNCPLEKKYKQLYLKAKMIELLTIQLDAYDQFQQKKLSGVDLKDEDIQRMERVRELIQENPDTFYTVSDLARMVGTNENYLKKYFKQLYGVAIIQYSMAVRMERAKGLLKQGEPIAQVASLSGYKHISHFTNAFKKYFGYTPGQL